MTDQLEGIRSRVEEMAEDGEISGQVAYYLLNGIWPREATEKTPKEQFEEDSPELAREMKFDGGF